MASPFAALSTTVYAAGDTVTFDLVSLQGISCLTFSYAIFELYVNDASVDTISACDAYTGITHLSFVPQRAVTNAFVSIKCGTALVELSDAAFNVDPAAPVCCSATILIVK